MKRLYILLGVILALTMALAPAALANNHKVTICHYPPGNPDNPRTIEISRNALETHLAHGDTEGPCSSSDDQYDNGDDPGSGDGVNPDDYLTGVACYPNQVVEAVLTNQSGEDLEDQEAFVRNTGTPGDDFYSLPFGPIPAGETGSISPALTEGTLEFVVGETVVGTEEISCQPEYTNPGFPDDPGEGQYDNPGNGGNSDPDPDAPGGGDAPGDNDGQPGQPATGGPDTGRPGASEGLPGGPKVTESPQPGAVVIETGEGEGLTLDKEAFESVQSSFVLVIRGGGEVDEAADVAYDKAASAGLTDAEATVVTEALVAEQETQGIRVLPDTGGASLWTLAGASLLIGAGLLLRIMPRR